MRILARLAILPLAVLGLAGCVAYPAAPGYYASSPYPYYAAPYYPGVYPAVVAPEVVVGGFGFYGRGYHR